MSIPIEIVRLPHRVKQALLDSCCYLFPPPRISLLLDACTAADLPSTEAYRFLQDLTLVNAKRPHGESINIVTAPSGRANHLIHACVADYISKGDQHTCVFIDCDGGFNPDFLVRMGVSREALVRVSILRVHSVESLLSSCHVAAQHSSLIVMDSLSSVLRHEDPRRVQSVLRVISRLFFGAQCIAVHQTTTDIEKDVLVPCFSNFLSKYFVNTFSKTIRFY